MESGFPSTHSSKRKSLVSGNNERVLSRREAQEPTRGSTRPLIERARSTVLVQRARCSSLEELV